MKFGFDYRRVISPFLDEEPLGIGIFSNAWQIQNDLAGTLEVINYLKATPVFNEYSLFAQDEWRVASRLSLSLGLRWELEPPPTFVDGPSPFGLTGNLSNPSSLGVAPAGAPLWQTPYLNFAPRLGAAYEVRTQTGWETVVRSGGGVFFDNDNFVAGATEDGYPFYGFYECPTATCGYPITPTVQERHAGDNRALHQHEHHRFPTHLRNCRIRCNGTSASNNRWAISSP